MSVKTQDNRNVPCAVFGICGGCQYQHLRYEEERQIKDQEVRRCFQDFLDTSEEVIEPIEPSPCLYHYRHRLDLKLKRTRSDHVLMGFTPSPQGRRLIEIDACPLADPAISQFLPQLKTAAMDCLPPSYRNANLVVRKGHGPRVSWGGIGRRSLKMEPEEYFWFDWQGLRIFYSLETFFQANLSILPAVIHRLRSLPVWDSQAVFLDLYGGVGLFGLTCADRVRQVILVEENAVAVEIARFNAAWNHIKHFQAVKGRVERKLSALREAHVGSPRVVLIDPPRGGLHSVAASVLAGGEDLDHLLYLSCSLKSLTRDCKVLLEGVWRIHRIFPFDFFPRTRHIETLVWFKRKKEVEDEKGSVSV